MRAGTRKGAKPGSSGGDDRPAQVDMTRAVDVAEDVAEDEERGAGRPAVAAAAVPASSSGVLQAFVWKFLPAIGLISMSLANGMTSRWAQNPDRTYPFKGETAVLLAEVCKLCICIIFLVQQGEGITERITPAGFMRFGVPGVVYFIQNNLTIWIFTFLEPGQVAIMVQTRIMYTVVLMYFLLGKTFTKIQLAAATLLFTGSIVSSSTSHCGDNEDEQSAAFTNMLWVQFVAVLSATAGVYSEALLKFDGNSEHVLAGTSIHKQNLQLYLWGIFFNVYPVFRDGVTTAFAGLGPAAFIMILSFALTGLVVSAVLKYLDNIIKIAAVSISSSISLTLSWIFFGIPISFHTMLGFVIVSVSTWLYNEGAAK